MGECCHTTRATSKNQPRPLCSSARAAMPPPHHTTTKGEIPA